MNPEISVRLSEDAAKKINSIIKNETSGAKILRVSVEGGGCSGFSYKFDLDKKPQPDDIQVSKNGATVVIDPVSIQYMNGATIDFVDSLIGQSFQIKNPNATSQCGCGTSFSV